MQQRELFQHKCHSNRHAHATYKAKKKLYNCGKKLAHAHQHWSRLSRSKRYFIFQTSCFTNIGFESSFAKHRVKAQSFLFIYEHLLFRARISKFWHEQFKNIQTIVANYAAFISGEKS